MCRVMHFVKSSFYFGVCIMGHALVPILIMPLAIICLSKLIESHMRNRYNAPL